MLMPSIFRESLFDDLMDSFSEPAWNRFYFTRPEQMMRTDVKETDKDYELHIDLPGYKKENVQAELKDGYLTITASTSQNNDEKDNEGKYLRRERYTGSMKRSFYVGENLKEEDIHARFENGILKLTFPKEQPKKAEEKKYISIEG